jgi:hypothetical protein
VKHGAHLNAAKHDARLARDRHRRRGEREAREILVAAGLQGDPLARLVARQIGRLEAMAHRLEAWHEHRGYFTAAGELKGSVSKQTEVVARLLDEARRLMEALKEHGPSTPAQHVHRVEFINAMDLDAQTDAANDAGLSVLEARREPAMARAADEVARQVGDDDGDADAVDPPPDEPAHHAPTVSPQRAALAAAALQRARSALGEGRDLSAPASRPLAAPVTRPAQPHRPTPADVHGWRNLGGDPDAD